MSVYDYSFLTAPVRADGVYTVANVQDTVQAANGTFPRRYLYSRQVEDVLPSSRRRKRLYEAFSSGVIEVKAEEFGASGENALADFQDTRRAALLVQAFVDEIYDLRGLGRPPEVAVVSTASAADGRLTTTWNINFAQLVKQAGGRVHFDASTPLAGAAHCNRLLWSAAQRKCDLYLGSEVSSRSV